MRLHRWLHLSRTDLETELRQCEEEGKDLAGLEEEFARVGALDLDNPLNQPAAQALVDRTAALPVRGDYPYHEPSDLEGIRAARPAARRALPARRLSDNELRDRGVAGYDRVSLRDLAEETVLLMDRAAAGS